MSCSRLSSFAMRSGLLRQARFASVGKEQPRVLITGALGQIGTELTRVLRGKYGAENVIASDIKIPEKSFLQDGPYKYIDVTNYHNLAQTVVEHNVCWIIHNSTLVSVTAEANPDLAMAVNIDGVCNVMNLAKNLNLRVLAPSTMGVFSPESGKTMTKDDAIMKPTTIYGVCKIFLEHLGTYYSRRYGVDFRCLRYPGIISYETLPGGGTTDYAIHMFYDALTKGKYVCPIDKNESLPMMYMSDCLEGTVSLLEADKSLLRQCVYNVAGVSFSPEQLAEEIRRHIPNFQVEYKVESKFQNIASSWPDSMDDSCARRDWNWSHKIDLQKMVVDMLFQIGKKVGKK